MPKNKGGVQVKVKDADVCKWKDVFKHPVSGQSTLHARAHTHTPSLPLTLTATAHGSHYDLSA